MKYFYLGLILFLLSCDAKNTKSEGEVDQISAPAQNLPPAIQPIADSATFTAIQWLDSTSIDLGNIKYGKVVPLKFKFKNSGEKNLHIDSVWAECGCTLLETAKKDYAPNETGTIAADFNTHNQAIATHVKRIFVKTNTTPHTGSILTFKAKIVE